MIKAASLLYAVFISLVIAILCGGLMLLFNFKMNLDTYFSGKTQLIYQNRATMSHVLHSDFRAINEEINISKISLDGIETKKEIVQWGAFEICSVVSYHNKDTIKQHTFMACGQSLDKPALYLRNNDTPFKISGDTYISGDVFVSGYGIEKTTISGSGIKNTPKHIGKIKLSRKQLPKRELPSFSFPERYMSQNLEAIEEGFFVNEFGSETIVFEVANSIHDIHLKGNIILQSKDSLVIGKTAILEDIIVVAPKVIYEPGFKGTTQTYATTEVILEKNVQLLYPSIIRVSDASDTSSFIHVKENSVVTGAIILEGNGLVTEDKKRIQIDKNALVKGDVFCDGVLSLYGVVEGSVIASSLLHKTNTATYTNLMYGGEIHAQKLLDHFFELPLVDYYTKQETIAIKQL